ncbi:MAG: large conductance mechanosensitive channel protein MscL [Clostridia bacterium]|nr:large conductance mechanosensitive channel protein MscL [Clostridia bacterium]
MKKFFGEFKKFITRGNVVDMSVGVIVGSSFTAIVNGMSNFILKPIINWLLFLIFGKDSLSDIYTYLHKVNKDVLDEAGAVVGTEVDLANSIYIDWGAFINAVLNFFIIAFVLFTIVKLINKFREENKEFSERFNEGYLNRAERKELRAQGIKLTDRDAIKAYFEKKKKAEEAAAAAKKAEEEEKARLEREANPTAEDLLKKILAEMQKKA